MNFQPPSRDWESKDESKAILKSVMLLFFVENPMDFAEVLV